MSCLRWRLISQLKNKAIVGLGSCDNVQTERKIFEYANWPRLQIKRTGPSSWSVQLVRPAGQTSRPTHWKNKVTDRQAKKVTSLLIELLVAAKNLQHFAHCQKLRCLALVLTLTPPPSFWTMSKRGPFMDGSTKHFGCHFYFYPVWTDFLVLWGKWGLLLFPRFTVLKTSHNSSP